MIEGLRHSAAVQFERAREVLIPNETVALVCQTREGFLIATNRRLVHLVEHTTLGYWIVSAIPYNAIASIDQKKDDRYSISGVEITSPRKSSEESTVEVRKYFQSTMERCTEIVGEMKELKTMNPDIASRDLTYLSKLPVSLTHNATLDLNAVLDDRPLHTELIDEARKLLGKEPFLLEDTIRDANEKENGILFAAGDQGYYWVQGKKQGRFLSNVIIDTIEWENFHNLKQEWNTEMPRIRATYSLMQGGKSTTKEYLWAPPITPDTLQCPWIVQPANGPYIFEDIVNRYSGKEMNLL